MSTTFDLRGMSVFIGMPAYRPIPIKTTLALAGTAYQCALKGIELPIGTELTGIITEARDGIIQQFLDSPATRLFWIDADIVWKPEDFIRLLALSTLKDVVGATYPAKVDGELQFYVKVNPGVPTEEFDMLPVDGMGLGFTICSRKAIEAIYEGKPESFNQISQRKTRNVFRVENRNGTMWGEDMLFFDDLRKLGFQPYIDTSIELGHIGEKEWRGKAHDGLVRKEANEKVGTA